jgi:hypothetical protein
MQDILNNILQLLILLDKNFIVKTELKGRAILIRNKNII